MRKSLASYISITLIIFLILLIYTIFALRATAISQAKIDLISFTNIIAHDITDGLHGGGYHVLKNDSLINATPINEFPKSSYNKHNSQYNCNYRITLINRDGVVIADNSVPLDKLDNHNNRKCVMAAWNGDVKNQLVTRSSVTTGATVIYYAVKLDIAKNPYVLRCAISVSSTIFSSNYFKLHTVAAVFVIFFAMMMVITALLLHNEKSTTQTLLKNSRNAQKAQEDFVANVSHELKTPITAILGFSQTLLDSDLTGDEYTFANIIYQNSRRLTTIINDLLSLCRLEQTNELPNLNNCNIFDEVTKIIDGYSIRLLSSGITSSVKCCDKNIICPLNAPFFETALGNLIENVLKYCPRGTHLVIEINKSILSYKTFEPNKNNVNVTSNLNNITGSKTKLSSQSCQACQSNRLYQLYSTFINKLLILFHKLFNLQNKPNYVIITASDNGPGIVPDSLPHIFDRFYRADKGRARDKGGSGLGLAITKEIIKLHGGTISVESNSNGVSGTRFTIKIPYIN